MIIEFRASRRRSAPVGALLLAVAVTGCGGSDTDGLADGSRVVRTDSAGVQIVDIPPDLLGEGLPEWQLAAEPLLTIGEMEGEAPYMFGSIEGATLLASGETVVLDEEAREVRLFDGEGTHLRSFGGEGDGPGEFRRPTLLRALEGSSFAVWDSGRRNLTTFDAEAGLLSTETPTFDGCPTGAESGRTTACDLGDLFPDGTRVTVFSPTGGLRSLVIPGPGEVANHPPLPSRVGVVHEGRVKILDSIMGPPEAVVRPGSMFVMVTTPFRTYGQWAVGPDRLAVADNGSFDVRVWDGEGTLRRILRSAMDVEAVTAERLEALRSAAEIRQDSTGEAHPLPLVLERGEIGDSVPVFGEMRMDRAGRLWLADYGPDAAVRPEPRWRWTVIDASGAPVGRVTTGSPDDLLEIGQDYVLVREIDELGVQRVAMYGLEGG